MTTARGQHEPFETLFLRDPITQLLTKLPKGSRFRAISQTSELITASE